MSEYYEINNQIADRVMQFASHSLFDWRESQKLGGFVGCVDDGFAIAICKKDSAKDQPIRIQFYVRDLEEVGNGISGTRDDDEINSNFELLYEFEPELHQKLAAEPPSFSERLILTAKARSNGQYERAEKVLDQLKSEQTLEELFQNPKDQTGQ